VAVDLFVDSLYEGILFFMGVFMKERNPDV
jgi:hypothetical protein